MFVHRRSKPSPRNDSREGWKVWKETDRDLSCHKWSCKEEGKEALAVAAAPCGAVGTHRRSSHALSKVKVCAAEQNVTGWLRCPFLRRVTELGALLPVSAVWPCPCPVTLVTPASATCLAAPGA